MMYSIDAYRQLVTKKAVEEVEVNHVGLRGNLKL